MSIFADVLKYMALTFFRAFSYEYCKGEVAEWSKAHAWKVCKPQKGFAGSNPALSANISFLEYFIF